VESVRKKMSRTELSEDTGNMSEDQKARHDKAIRKLEEKLFAD